MAEFFVEQRQTGVQTYVVEAHSRAEAIRLVKEGDGHAVGFKIVGTIACTAIKNEEGDYLPELTVARHARRQ